MSDSSSVGSDRSLFRPQPVRLEGSHVRLEPLAVEHAEALYDAGRDDETWSYMPRPALDSPQEARRFVESALREAVGGRQVPFAIVSVAEGVAVGSTRYLDIQLDNRALEIGWTWLAPRVRRTGINTECKLLLLEHAFETHGAIRVQLKTDGRNLRSQRSIERIGAHREGTLRRSRICWDGFVRDTVYFSILDDEWPRVRDGLRARLAAHED